MCDERYTTREAKAMLLSGAVKGDNLVKWIIGFIYSF
jgi:hypothetical protein